MINLSQFQRSSQKLLNRIEQALIAEDEKNYPSEKDRPDYTFTTLKSGLNELLYQFSRTNDDRRNLSEKLEDAEKEIDGLRARLLRVDGLREDAEQRAASLNNDLQTAHRRWQHAEQREGFLKNELYSVNRQRQLAEHEVGWLKHELTKERHGAEENLQRGLVEENAAYLEKSFRDMESIFQKDKDGLEKSTKERVEELEQKHNTAMQKLVGELSQQQVALDALKSDNANLTTKWNELDTTSKKRMIELESAHVEKVSNMLQKYQVDMEAMKRTHMEEKAAMEKRHDAEQTKSKEDYERRLKEQEERFNDRRDRQSATHEKDIAGLGYEISKLQQALDAEKQQGEGRLTEKQQEMEKRLQEVQREKERKLQEMEREMDRRLQEMQRRHDLEKTKMDQDLSDAQQKVETEREKVERRIQELQQGHDLERTEMDKDYSEALQKVNAEKDKMERAFKQKSAEMEHRHRVDTEKVAMSFKSDMSKMANAFNEEKQKLKKHSIGEKQRVEEYYSAMQVQLRNEVDSLNKVILARDPFQTTTLDDREIQSKFADLVSDVDYLSREEWTINQTEWTDDILGRLSKNQRRLKKQLLQDSIWIVLYESIFCSPFRVFGEEGEDLEAQWCKQFETEVKANGENEYRWPAPTLDSERWRYDTIKNFQKVLKEPAPEWDPRARLKKDHKECLSDITKELSDLLGKISKLNKETTKTIADIPKKAANIWLEMCAQRCRILVSMPGSHLLTTPKRIIQAQEASLNLVDVPAVLRFGDSKGQNLDIEQKVILEGKTTRVPE